MKTENRELFVDTVAQAVIDRIEEQAHLMGLVEAVAARVLAIRQKKLEANTVQRAERKVVLKN